MWNTNREWLESLSNDDMAAFLTNNLELVCVSTDEEGNNDVVSSYFFGIDSLRRSFGHTFIGIVNWLDSPCCYITKKDYEASESDLWPR